MNCFTSKNKMINNLLKTSLKRLLLFMIVRILTQYQTVILAVVTVITNAKQVLLKNFAQSQNISSKGNKVEIYFAKRNSYVFIYKWP